MIGQLIAHGRLSVEAMTVTGRTIGESYRDAIDAIAPSDAAAAIAARSAAVKRSPLDPGAIRREPTMASYLPRFARAACPAPGPHAWYIVGSETDSAAARPLAV